MAPRERKAPRLFVDGARERGVFVSGSSSPLPPSDSHYIRDVLRLPVGATLELGDPKHPGVFRATIDSLDPHVTVTIHELLEESVADLQITLLCALCKGQKNDLICDWATELGCARIIFWQAERSVVRLHSGHDREAKTHRLSKIATAAAQQSRQVRTPEVLVVDSLDDALQKLLETAQAPDLKLRCSLEHDALLIAETLSAHSNTNSVALVIGPEGDISPSEHERLAKASFLPVSLGPKVLRSELAVVTALASLRMR